MYHLLHWQQLDASERPIAAAVEEILRRAVGPEREAAIDDLRNLSGYRVMTAGQMRGIRAAMAWAGMGDTPEIPWAAAAAGPPWRPARPPADPVGGTCRPREDGASEDAGPGGRPHVADTHGADAAADTNGNGASGIPLRTLTIPGLTWDVRSGSCTAALAAWRTVLDAWRPHADLIYELAGLTTEQRRQTWLSWLTFLTGAVSHGGFHGEGRTHPINRGHPYGRG